MFVDASKHKGRNSLAEVAMFTYLYRPNISNAMRLACLLLHGTVCHLDNSLWKLIFVDSDSRRRCAVSVINWESHLPLQHIIANLTPDCDITAPLHYPE